MPVLLGAPVPAVPAPAPERLGEVGEPGAHRAEHARAGVDHGAARRLQHRHGHRLGQGERCPPPGRSADIPPRPAPAATPGPVARPRPVRLDTSAGVSGPASASAAHSPVRIPSALSSIPRDPPSSPRIWPITASTVGSVAVLAIARRSSRTSCSPRAGPPGPVCPIRREIRTRESRDATSRLRDGSVRGGHDRYRPRARARRPTLTAALRARRDQQPRTAEPLSATGSTGSTPRSTPS